MGRVMPVPLGIFQSTLPARGATISTLPRGSTARDFNPRSPRGERHVNAAHGIAYLNISIHAPREGSDHRILGKAAPTLIISIHAPREGSDRMISIIRCLLKIFQSTLPARGATIKMVCLLSLGLFQSTLPARGATKRARYLQKRIDISIHAPREGSDVSDRTIIILSGYFNPRSPRGERRSALINRHKNLIFQSTLPARGATCARASRADSFEISIHAPREGSDAAVQSKLHPPQPFQSTLPARGATPSAADQERNCKHFNPRSPRGERPYEIYS